MSMAGPTGSGQALLISMAPERSLDAVSPFLSSLKPELALRAIPVERAAELTQNEDWALVVFDGRSDDERTRHRRHEKQTACGPNRNCFR